MWPCLVITAKAPNRSVEILTITENIVYPIYKGKIPFCFPRFLQEKRTVSPEVIGCIVSMLIQNECYEYWIIIYQDIFILSVHHGSMLVERFWEEPAASIMWSLFLDWNEVSYRLNAIPSNEDCTDLCQYCLITFEGMLF